VESDDGFFFHVSNQKSRGTQPLCSFTRSPIALSSVVELAGSYAQPMNESSDGDLGILRPAPDKIRDLIPHIMRHPGLGQSSPRLFLNQCVPPLARPGPRPWSAPSPKTQSVSVSPPPGGEDAPSERGRSVLERLFLPGVKHRRPQTRFFIQIGNGDLV